MLVQIQFKAESLKYGNINHYLYPNKLITYLLGEKFELIIILLAGFTKALLANRDKYTVS